MPLPPVAAPWLVLGKTEGHSRNRRKPDSDSFQECSFLCQDTGNRPDSLPGWQYAPQGTCYLPYATPPTPPVPGERELLTLRGELTDPAMPRAQQCPAQSPHSPPSQQHLSPGAGAACGTLMANPGLHLAAGNGGCLVH